MNLQEILTYVEELSFKNSMFGGYDKDEVDIQLDKICDEVEALVTQKDKEIEDLKNKLNAMAKGSMSAEDLSKIFASEAAAPENMVSREEYDALAEECEQLKADLEQAKLVATATKDEDNQTDEAVQLLVGEIEAAKVRAAQAEEATEAAKAELAALKAEIQAWQEAEEAKIVEEEVEETPEPEPTPAPAAAPANTEQAYSQYMMYADLLCKQLAEVETKHAKIVDEATVEADQIIASAKAEADQLVSDAQNVYDARNEEATQQAQGIVDTAKEEAEAIVDQAKEEADGIVNKAKAEAENIGQESLASAAAAKEQCEALQAKKDALIASLSGFGDEITALISKVQGE